MHASLVPLNCCCTGVPVLCLFLSRDVGESEPLFESEEPVRAGEEEEEESNRGILWVEKYSPKSYTELLSDDVG